MIAVEEKQVTPGKELEAVDSDLAAYWVAMMEGIQQGNLNLPLMPRAAQNVIGMANNPETDVAELAAVIQRDQALSGHVLRIANSAAFGGRESISSLQQAATRLGMKFVADAAFAVSLKSDMFRVKGLEHVAAAIWKHALAAAVYGKEIARVRRRNIECQYLCGLLHTIGKPVGLNLLAKLRIQNEWELTDADLLLLNETAHPQLGGRLVEEWSLPRQIVHVCRFYQQPKAVTEFEEETAMTYLSSRLAEWVVGEFAGDEAELRADGIFQQLNLYPDEVDELLGLRETVSETVDALNL